MEIFIIATRDCSHCSNLKRKLTDMHIDFEVRYAEDHPDLVEKYAIRHSPNLIVDGKAAFRRQPTDAELQELFKEEA